MKDKNISKLIFSVLLVILTVFSGCSEWTDVESLSIDDPDISEQNPKLYQDYLENLRAYKKSDHKATYVWFDNSEKVPFSRGQHINSLPDSVDVIALMYPEHLVQRELDEMEEVREDKGMKVIFTLSYDAIKLQYEQMQKEQASADAGEEGSNIEIPDFISFLVDSVQYALSLVDQYNYDGISVGYQGKSILHMTETEREQYTANERTFIGILKDWADRNQDKMMVFEGKPQNLIDKMILETCKFIIIPCEEATSAPNVSYNVMMACTEGVPTDRFMVITESTSLDKTDSSTGYWVDGTPAVTSTAIWVMKEHSDFKAAGLGIRHANNDYYNPGLVYQYTRTAINTMNPSLKN